MTYGDLGLRAENLLPGTPRMTIAAAVMTPDALRRELRAMLGDDAHSKMLTTVQNAVEAVLAKAKAVKPHVATNGWSIPRWDRSCPARGLGGSRLTSPGTGRFTAFARAGFGWLRSSRPLWIARTSGRAQGGHARRVRPREPVPGVEHQCRLEDQ
jgi:hypothetical protein